MSIAISGSTITFADLTTQTSAPVSGVSFKNRIINGDMRIWQRGTSTTGVGYLYSADRWAFGMYANTTISQSASVPTGFQYSLKLQRPAAATATAPILAMQTIESVNCLDMAGQSVTLSFYAKAGANYSSSGGTLSIQVYTGTVADQGGVNYATWTGAAQPISGVVALTTTFQRFTLTGTFASNVLAVAPTFFYAPVGTAGADDSVYITGVQLEAGSTATDFERRPIGTELALCQRYCFVAPQNWAYGYGGSGSTLVNFSTAAYFPVPMRITPVVSSLSFSVSNCSSPAQSALISYRVSYSTFNTVNGAASFGNNAGAIYSSEL